MIATVATPTNQQAEDLAKKLELLVLERQTDEILNQAEALAVELRKVLKSARVRETTKERAIAATLAAIMLLMSKPDLLVPTSLVAIHREQLQPANSPSPVRDLETSVEEIAAAGNKLFETPKSIGAIAIGHAEGNYDVDGNPQSAYYGHLDPGNGVKNQGFCSDQGRGGGDVAKADRACLNYNKRAIRDLSQRFKKAGVNPTAFEFLVAVDFHNQAHPSLARGFPRKLVELKEKYKDKGIVEYVASVRAASFWVNGKNTATGLLRACRTRSNPPESEWDCVYQDQLRRVRAIARALEHNKVALNAPLVSPRQSARSPGTLAFAFPFLKRGQAPALQPSRDVLAQKIVAAMEKKGYPIARKDGEVNIVYLRQNEWKATNSWDARRIIVTFKQNKPQIVFDAEATSYPGDRFIFGGHPRGGPILKNGHYAEVWQVGTHVGMSGENPHEALIQVAPLQVWRDSDRDRVGDAPETGFQGINIHASQRLSETVEAASAGCPVTRGMAPHRTFMRLVKSDPRYLENSKFRFSATFINREEI
jgi:D-alanyl-D-alanine dipeptidase